MAQSLFESSDVDKWADVLAHYETVLKLKASKMTKSSTKPRGGKDLLDLDGWYQNELPSIIGSREHKHITRDELCKLMKWKLTRGKFRPRLTELVQANTEEDVMKASKKAFSKLPNAKAAITALSVLKAVGPATASAVLAACAPHEVPFMADESMLAIPGLQPLDYKLNFFECYNEQVSACVQRLNESGSVKEWTPHKVELALWTWYTAHQIDPTVLSKTSGKKRKSLDDGGSLKKTVKK